MKERLSVVDQAELIVERSEEAFLKDLSKWTNDAEHRAIGCGCSHCIAEAERSRNVLTNELTRLYCEDDLGPLEEPTMPLDIQIYSFDNPESPYGTLPGGNP